MSKIISWLIALPISFIAITLLSVADYIRTVFNMPFEVWDAINRNTNDN